MKNYAKVVQAVQYLGDVNVLKGVVAKVDLVVVREDYYLFKVSGMPRAGYTKLEKGDYVFKENGIISVYSKEKFETDFSEVIVENITPVQELEVVEPVVVKAEKKVAAKKETVEKKD